MILSDWPSILTIYLPQQLAPFLKKFMRIPLFWMGNSRKSLIGCSQFSVGSGKEPGLFNNIRTYLRRSGICIILRSIRLIAFRLHLGWLLQPLGILAWLQHWIIYLEESLKIRSFRGWLEVVQVVQLDLYTADWWDGVELTKNIWLWRGQYHLNNCSN